MQEEHQIQTKDDPIDVLIRLLFGFEKSKEMLQIYTNYGDSQKFHVGFVQALTSSEILIAHITPYGKYDGYIVKQLKDLYRIESQSKYTDKLKKLYTYEQHAHTIVRQTQSSLFADLLHFASQSKKIVSIELNESDNDDVIGFVDSLEGEVAVIRAIDEYGKSDGVSCVRISAITHMVCDSENEVALKMLASN